MIRIIVRETDVGAAANVGAPVAITWKTFDVDAPEVEAHLRETVKENMAYVGREVVGVEVVDVKRGFAPCPR